MEIKDKALNITMLGIILIATPQYILTSNSSMDDLYHWIAILAFGIIGIAILLYGLMFLGVVIPEKICDLIATIGLIIASVLIILEPILVQFLKP